MDGLSDLIKGTDDPKGKDSGICIVMQTAIKISADNLSQNFWKCGTFIVLLNLHLLTKIGSQSL